jgi:hypothetical protein
MSLSDKNIRFHRVIVYNVTSMKEQNHTENLTPVGWREWVGFPEWGLDFLKAKVDTGARTSSLHAEDIRIFKRGGVEMVSFTVHPWQKSRRDGVQIETALISRRNVRSSSGSLEKRPVVTACISVAGTIIKAELTLTNRDQMGFRMLLGREALRGKFMVAAGLSYIGGKPGKHIRWKNRGRA